MISEIGDPMVNVFLTLPIKDKIRLLQSNKSLANTISNVFGKDRLHDMIEHEKEQYITHTNQLNALLEEEKIDWNAVKTLLQTDLNSKNVFLNACYDGQYEIVKDLLKQGINKQMTTPYGNNAIVSVIQGYKSHGNKMLYERILSMLLEYGVRVTSEDKIGDTPLHYASSYGTVGMVHMILSQGANINKKNIHGQTPLTNAYSWGNDDVIKVLLQRGANPTIKDKYGELPKDYYHSIA
jgi:ankyrin repeat protein